MSKSIAIAALALGACSTEPIAMPFAAVTPAPQPITGDVVILPVACSMREPRFWGDELARDAGAAACDRAAVDDVDRRVRDGLAARGYRVRAHDPAPTIAVFEQLDRDDRARAMHELGAAAVARVAASFWRDAGRVTITIATDDRPYARVATCRLELYSHARDRTVAGDEADVMGRAASCAIDALLGAK